MSKTDSDKKIVDAVNDELGKFTVNKYEAHVPYGAILKHLEGQGFEPSDPEDTPFVLCGHKGQVTIEFVNAEHPTRDYFLHLSWYRMGSGNFETVARFESLGKKKRGRG